MTQQNKDVVLLTSSVDKWYVYANGKKILMFRNQAIQQAFDEMGVTAQDFENNTEGEEQATAYLQELFKDYKADFPDAFAETNWFDTYNKTKFKLFDKRAKDHWLEYAGYQSSGGERWRSGETLYSWLPVRIGSERAYLWSNHDNERAWWSYGRESDALPIHITIKKTQYWNDFVNREALQYDWSDTRVSSTWATRDTDVGKLEYSRYIHPLADYSFATYMKGKQIIGGEYRRGDNRQKWLWQESLFDSLCRHMEIVKLLYKWYRVFETKKDGVVQLHHEEPQWSFDFIEEKTMESELNAIRFNEEWLKLYYMWLYRE